MNFDTEIRKVEQILKGRFDNPQDRRYWEDKLEQLKSRKESYENNLRIRNEYMKGVNAWHEGLR